ncbi:RDD family protein [Actinokineospora terrae]|uniref:RDD family protein n=2 Tax=Actinokineospora TaxID=39845 RepID=A0A421AVX8_9PSEU|nr:RDD family protein [Actinokineospora cianjurensis]SES35302.1 RDD family protein [Actinokineospora terrae]
MPGRVRAGTFYAGRVSRWTGTWLSGPGAGLDPADGPVRYRGERLGAPENGPGSVASNGIRLGALVIDLVLSSLVTSVFLRPDYDDPTQMWRFNIWAGLVWLLITVAGVALAGFTPGKGLLGLRVVRMDGTALVGPFRALPRTLLIAVIIPAAITDKDGRGLHDRLTGTIVLRTR